MIYTYEADPATKVHVPTGVHRGTLKADFPFPVQVSLELS